MKNFIDYYKVLNVSSEATGSEITSSYKKLVTTYQLYKGDDTETMNKINEAYKILSEPLLRDNYDILYKKYCKYIIELTAQTIRKKITSSQQQAKKNISSTTLPYSDVYILINQTRKICKEKMIEGFVWLVSGIVISFLSCLFLSTDSVTKVVVCYGAILWGGYAVIKSAYYYFFPMQLINKAKTSSSN